MSDSDTVLIKSEPSSPSAAESTSSARVVVMEEKKEVGGVGEGGNTTNKSKVAPSSSSSGARRRSSSSSRKGVLSSSFPSPPQPQPLLEPSTSSLHSFPSRSDSFSCRSNSNNSSSNSTTRSGGIYRHEQGGVSPPSTIPVRQKQRRKGSEQKEKALGGGRKNRANNKNSNNATSNSSNNDYSSQESGECLTPIKVVTSEIPSPPPLSSLPRMTTFLVPDAKHTSRNRSSATTGATTLAKGSRSGSLSTSSNNSSSSAGKKQRLSRLKSDASSNNSSSSNSILKQQLQLQRVVSAGTTVHDAFLSSLQNINRNNSSIRSDYDTDRSSVLSFTSDATHGPNKGVGDWSNALAHVTTSSPSLSDQHESSSRMFPLPSTPPSSHHPFPHPLLGKRNSTSKSSNDQSNLRSLSVSEMGLKGTRVFRNSMAHDDAGEGERMRDAGSGEEEGSAPRLPRVVGTWSEPTEEEESVVVTSSMTIHHMAPQSVNDDLTEYTMKPTSGASITLKEAASTAATTMMTTTESSGPSSPSPVRENTPVGKVRTRPPSMAHSDAFVFGSTGSAPSPGAASDLATWNFAAPPVQSSSVTHATLSSFDNGTGAGVALGAGLPSVDYSRRPSHVLNSTTTNTSNALNNTLSGTHSLSGTIASSGFHAGGSRSALETPFQLPTAHSNSNNNNNAVADSSSYMMASSPFPLSFSFCAQDVAYDGQETERENTARSSALIKTTNSGCGVGSISARRSDPRLKRSSHAHDDNCEVRSKSNSRSGSDGVRSDNANPTREVRTGDNDDDSVSDANTMPPSQDDRSSHHHAMRRPSQNESAAGSPLSLAVPLGGAGKLEQMCRRSTSDQPCNPQQQRNAQRMGATPSSPAATATAPSSQGTAHAASTTTPRVVLLESTSDTSLLPSSPGTPSPYNSNMKLASPQQQQQQQMRYPGTLLPPVLSSPPSSLVFHPMRHKSPSQQDSQQQQQQQTPFLQWRRLQMTSPLQLDAQQQQQQQQQQARDSSSGISTYIQRAKSTTVMSSSAATDPFSDTSTHSDAVSAAAAAAVTNVNPTLRHHWNTEFNVAAGRLSNERDDLPFGHRSLYRLFSSLSPDNVPLATSSHSASAAAGGAIEERLEEDGGNGRGVSNATAGERGGSRSGTSSGITGFTSRSGTGVTGGMNSDGVVTRNMSSNTPFLHSPLSNDSDHSNSVLSGTLGSVDYVLMDSLQNNRQHRNRHRDSQRHDGKRHASRGKSQTNPTGLHPSEIARQTSADQKRSLAKDRLKGGAGGAEAEESALRGSDGLGKKLQSSAGGGAGVVSMASQKSLTSTTKKAFLLEQLRRSDGSAVIPGLKYSDVVEPHQKQQRQRNLLRTSTGRLDEVGDHGYSSTSYTVSTANTTEKNTIAKTYSSNSRMDPRSSDGSFPMVASETAASRLSHAGQSSVERARGLNRERSKSPSFVYPHSPDFSASRYLPNSAAGVLSVASFQPSRRATLSVADSTVVESASGSPSPKARRLPAGSTSVEINASPAEENPLDAVEREQQRRKDMLTFIRQQLRLDNVAGVDDPRRQQSQSRLSASAGGSIARSGRTNGLSQPKQTTPVAMGNSSSSTRESSYMQSDNAPQSPASIRRPHNHQQSPTPAVLPTYRSTAAGSPNMPLSSHRLQMEDNLAPPRNIRSHSKVVAGTMEGEKECPCSVRVLTLTPSLLRRAWALRATLSPTASFTNASAKPSARAKNIHRFNAHANGDDDDHDDANDKWNQSETAVVIDDAFLSLLKINVLRLLLGDETTPGKAQQIGTPSFTSLHSPSTAVTAAASLTAATTPQSSPFGPLTRTPTNFGTATAQDSEGSYNNNNNTGKRASSFATAYIAGLIPASSSNTGSYPYGNNSNNNNSSNNAATAAGAVGGKESATSKEGSSTASAIPSLLFPHSHDHGLPPLQLPVALMEGTRSITSGGAGHSTTGATTTTTNPAAVAAEGSTSTLAAMTTSNAANLNASGAQYQPLRVRHGSTSNNNLCTGDLLQSLTLPSIICTDPAQAKQPANNDSRSGSNPDQHNHHKSNNTLTSQSTTITRDDEEGSIGKEGEFLGGSHKEEQQNNSNNNNNNMSNSKNSDTREMATMNDGTNTNNASAFATYSSLAGTAMSNWLATCNALSPTVATRVLGSLATLPIIGVECSAIQVRADENHGEEGEADKNGPSGVGAEGKSHNHHHHHHNRHRNHHHHHHRHHHESEGMREDSHTQGGTTAGNSPTPHSSSKKPHGPPRRGGRRSKSGAPALQKKTAENRKKKKSSRSHRQEQHKLQPRPLHFDGGENEEDVNTTVDSIATINTNAKGAQQGKSLRRKLSAMRKTKRSSKSRARSAHLSRDTSDVKDAKEEEDGDAAVSPSLSSPQYRRRSSVVKKKRRHHHRQQGDPRSCSNATTAVGSGVVRSQPSTPPKSNNMTRMASVSSFGERKQSVERGMQQQQQQQHRRLSGENDLGSVPEEAGRVDRRSRSNNRRRSASTTADQKRTRSRSVNSMIRINTSGWDALINSRWRGGAREEDPLVGIGVVVEEGGENDEDVGAGKPVGQEGEDEECFSPCPLVPEHDKLLQRQQQQQQEEGDVDGSGFRRSNSTHGNREIGRSDHEPTARPLVSEEGKEQQGENVHKTDSTGNDHDTADNHPQRYGSSDSNEVVGGGAVRGKSKASSSRPPPLRPIGAYSFITAGTGSEPGSSATTTTAAGPNGEILTTYVSAPFSGATSAQPSAPYPISRAHTSSTILSEYARRSQSTRIVLTPSIHAATTHTDIHLEEQPKLVRSMSSVSNHDSSSFSVSSGSRTNSSETGSRSGSGRGNSSSCSCSRSGSGSISNSNDNSGSSSCAHTASSTRSDSSAQRHPSRSYSSDASSSRRNNESEVDNDSRREARRRKSRSLDQCTLEHTPVSSRNEFVEKKTRGNDATPVKKEPARAAAAATATTTPTASAGDGTALGDDVPVATIGIAFPFVSQGNVGDVYREWVNRAEPSYAEREVAIRNVIFAVLTQLQALHKAGYVHGSIKTTNIFLRSHASEAIDLVAQLTRGAWLSSPKQQPMATMGGSNGRSKFTRTRMTSASVFGNESLNNTHNATVVNQFSFTSPVQRSGIPSGSPVFQGSTPTTRFTNPGAPSYRAAFDGDGGPLGGDSTTAPAGAGAGSAVQSYMTTDSSSAGQSPTSFMGAPFSLNSNFPNVRPGNNINNSANAGPTTNTNTASISGSGTGGGAAAKGTGIAVPPAVAPLRGAGSHETLAQCALHRLLNEFREVVLADNYYSCVEQAVAETLMGVLSNSTHSEDSTNTPPRRAHELALFTLEESEYVPPPESITSSLPKNLREQENRLSSRFTSAAPSMEPTPTSAQNHLAHAIASVTSPLHLPSCPDGFSARQRVDAATTSGGGGGEETALSPSSLSPRSRRWPLENRVGIRTPSQQRRASVFSHGSPRETLLSSMNTARITTSARNTYNPKSTLTPASDVWMVGMLAIHLAEGGFPTLLKLQERPMPSIRRGRWSHKFVGFVQSCVTANLSKRPTVDALLEDPWFKAVIADPWCGGEDGWEVRAVVAAPVDAAHDANAPEVGDGVYSAQVSARHTSGFNGSFTSGTVLGQLDTFGAMQSVNTVSALDAMRSSTSASILHSIPAFGKPLGGYDRMWKWSGSPRTTALNSPGRQRSHSPASTVVPNAEDALLMRSNSHYLHALHSARTSPQPNSAARRRGGADGEELSPARSSPQRHWTSLSKRTQPAKADDAQDAAAPHVSDSEDAAAAEKGASRPTGDYTLLEKRANAHAMVNAAIDRTSKLHRRHNHLEQWNSKTAVTEAVQSSDRQPPAVYRSTLDLLVEFASIVQRWELQHRSEWKRQQDRVEEQRNRKLQQQQQHQLTMLKRNRLSISHSAARGGSTQSKNASAPQASSSSATSQTTGAAPYDPSATITSFNPKTAYSAYTTGALSKRKAATKKLSPEQRPVFRVPAKAEMDTALTAIPENVASTLSLKRLKQASPLPQSKAPQSVRSHRPSSSLSPALSARATNNKSTKPIPSARTKNASGTPSGSARRPAPFLATADHSLPSLASLASVTKGEIATPSHRSSSVASSSTASVSGMSNTNRKVRPRPGLSSAAGMKAILANRRRRNNGLGVSANASPSGTLTAETGVKGIGKAPVMQQQQQHGKSPAVPLATKDSGSSSGSACAAEDAADSLTKTSELSEANNSDAHSGERKQQGGARGNDGAGSDDHEREKANASGDAGGNNGAANRDVAGGEGELGGPGSDASGSSSSSSSRASSLRSRSSNSSSSSSSSSSDSDADNKNNNNNTDMSGAERGFDSEEEEDTDNDIDNDDDDDLDSDDDAMLMSDGIGEHPDDSGKGKTHKSKKRRTNNGDTLNGSASGALPAVSTTTAAARYLFDGPFHGAIQHCVESLKSSQVRSSTSIGASKSAAAAQKQQKQQRADKNGNDDDDDDNDGDDDESEEEDEDEEDERVALVENFCQAFLDLQAASQLSADMWCASLVKAMGRDGRTSAALFPLLSITDSEQHMMAFPSSSSLSSSSPPPPAPSVSSPTEFKLSRQQSNPLSTRTDTMMTSAAGSPTLAAMPNQLQNQPSSSRSSSQQQQQQRDRPSLLLSPQISMSAASLITGASVSGFAGGGGGGSSISPSILGGNNNNNNNATNNGGASSGSTTEDASPSAFHSYLFCKWQVTSQNSLRQMLQCDRR